MAVFSGSSGRLALGSQQVLPTVRVDYFDEAGGTNFVMTGTNCTYDVARRMASSPDVLRVRSGDGQLDLEGVGFTWWQTNSDMVLSNRVVTVVRRTERGSTGTGPGPLRVESGSLRFNYQSNLIVYAGGVRVHDARLVLTCQTLTLVRSGNVFERIVADGDVVVRETAGGSQATGRQAVYVLKGAEETVELTGNPRWEGGGRSGTADKFVLDRKRDILRALGTARLVLPLGDPSRTRGFAFPLWVGGGTERPPAGGRLIEVTAEAIAIQLPPTNGPVRSVVAETNVVLLDPARDSRVTAQRAESDESGGMRLSGSPVWTSGEQSLRGGTMRFEGGRGAFVVEPDARVRFPVAALGRSLPTAAGGGGAGGTDSRALTNHFIEVSGPRLEWRDSWLRIEGGAEADYWVGEQRAGAMRCRSLGVQYSNQVQRITAAGAVAFDQFPVRDARGRSISRTGRCDTLEVRFDELGNVAEGAADGGVEVTQTVQPARGTGASVRYLRCRQVRAGFTPPPYRVDHALASGGVTVGEGERSAEGEQASYEGASGWIELSGHPSITLAEGRIWDATTIGWAPETGKYRVAGRFKSRWKALPMGTNLNRLLPAK